MIPEITTSIGIAAASRCLELIAPRLILNSFTRRHRSLRVFSLGKVSSARLSPQNSNFDADRRQRAARNHFWDKWIKNEPGRTGKPKTGTVALPGRTVLRHYLPAHQSANPPLPTALPH